jgi:CubicO group peptidase (beta-lactamase class C family)
MQKILPLIIALFCVIVVDAQDNKTADSLINAFKPSSGASISVLIKSKDEIVYRNVAGYSVIEKKTKATSSSVYHLSGLSVQINCLAIMKLMESEKLSYAETLSDIFPDFSEAGKQVTIQSLLQNSSGLPHIDLSKIEKVKGVLTNQLVYDKVKTTDSLLYTPGKNYDLNEINDILLALIVEKKSGKPYPVYIQNEILKPLGISGKIATGGKLKIKTLAPGYVNDNGFFKPWLNKEAYMCYGNAHIYMTIDEYLKIVNAYETAGFLKQTTLDNALKLNFMPGYFKFSSFGWDISFNSGKRYDFKSANQFGNTHIVLRIPDQKMTIIIFTNQDAVFNMRKLAFSLLNLYSSHSFKPD